MKMCVEAGCGRPLTRYDDATLICRAGHRYRLKRPAEGDAAGERVRRAVSPVVAGAAAGGAVAVVAEVARLLLS